MKRANCPSPRERLLPDCNLPGDDRGSVRDGKTSHFPRPAPSRRAVVRLTGTIVHRARNQSVLRRADDLVSHPPKPSPIVNLVGPSGVGEKTLSRALRRRDSGLVPLSAPWKPKLAYHLFKNSALLLPTFLRHYGRTRWFTWREMSFLAGISAAYNSIKHRRYDNTMIIMMNGSLYQ
jgi:hypothetical protein